MERGAAHDITGMEQPTAQGNAAARRTQYRAGKAARRPRHRVWSFCAFFTLPGVDPFDEVTWEHRSAVIGNERGEVVFEQRDVEIPSFWSQQATTSLSRSISGDRLVRRSREHVKQLIGRVVTTITSGLARTATSRRKTIS